MVPAHNPSTQEAEAGGLIAQTEQLCITRRLASTSKVASASSLHMYIHVTLTHTQTIHMTYMWGKKQKESQIY